MADDATATIDSNLVNSLRDVVAGIPPADYQQQSSGLIAALSSVLYPAIHSEAAAGETVRLVRGIFEALPSTSTSGEAVVTTAETYADAGPISSTQVLQTALLDVFWSLDTAFEAAGESWPAKESSPNRLKLRQILQGLAADDCLPLAMQKLRIGLLVAPDPATEGRIVQGEIRTRTAMFYKQQKYNLLREESEGYAKLVTILIGHMGPPHDSKTAKPSETAVNRLCRAKLAMQDIQALVGHFDLDPTRTLDILLDVFSDNILAHHAFFRDLLRLSPWGRSDGQPDLSDNVEEPNTESGLEPDGSLPRDERGNFICGQVLGFKFKYYQASDVKTGTPEKLFLLAAILIRDGLVKLSELYTHLSPVEEEMPSFQAKWTTGLAEKAREGSSTNALAMAGTLDGSSSTLGASSSDRRAEKPKETPNQKAGLLRACLTVGDLTSSVFILSKFPWLLAAYPESADLLLKIMEHYLQPVYAQLAAHTAADVDTALGDGFALRREPYSGGKSAPSIHVKYALTSRSLPSGKASLENVFFFSEFSEWADDLEVDGQNPERMLKVVLRLLKFIGPHTSRNITFFTKLLRIGAQQLDGRTINDAKDAEPWAEVIRMHILPALTISDPNPGLTTALWSVLAHFPYAIRYSFYGEWKERAAKLYPDVKFKRAQADKNTKSLLKRLGSDVAKRFGRQFAKIAHTDPGTIFTIALKHIQSYDNMIVPVVEAARYLSAFEYDVMSYSILEALSDPSRQRIKSDGLHQSDWLANSSTFIANLHKRWSFDLRLPIEYCVKQLARGNTTDLLVLREIFKQLGGAEIIAPADISGDTLWASAGGPILKAEVAHPMNLAGVIGKTQKKAVPKYGLRLQAVLIQQKLGHPLLIRIALARQQAISDISDGDNPQLRALGNKYDQIHASLLQFVEYLKTNVASYTLVAPSLEESWSTYLIDPSVAFHFIRPILCPKLREHDLKMFKQKQDAAKAKLPATDTEREEGEEDSKVDVVDSDNPEEPPAWHPLLESSNAVADQMLAPSFKAYIQPGLFTTFWTLELSDIYLPATLYQDVRKRLNFITDAAAAQPMTEAEREGVKVKVAYQSLTLDSESKSQRRLNEAVLARLIRECPLWFPGSPNNRRHISEQLMAKLVMPRACMSPSDAIFAARFVRLMHEIGTPNFASLMFYDRLFGEHMMPIAFQFTEDEARNFGRFLADVLSLLSEWHKSEKEYNAEALGLDTKAQGKRTRVGFIQRAGALANISSVTKADYLAHAKFKSAYNKWQRNACKALKTCLESKQHMSIKNGLLLLDAIADYFPFEATTGQALLTTVEQLRDAESEASGRPDLRLLALSYAGKLKKMSDGWIKPAREAQLLVTPAKAPQSEASASSGADKETKAEIPIKSEQVNGNSKVAAPSQDAEKPTPMEVDAKPSTKEETSNSAQTSTKETSVLETAQSAGPSSRPVRSAEDRPPLSRNTSTQAPAPRKSDSDRLNGRSSAHPSEADSRTRSKAGERPDMPPPALPIPAPSASRDASPESTHSSRSRDDRRRQDLHRDDRDDRRRGRDSRRPDDRGGRADDKDRPIEADRPRRASPERAFNRDGPMSPNKRRRLEEDALPPRSDRRDNSTLREAPVPASPGSINGPRYGGGRSAIPAAANGGRDNTSSIPGNSRDHPRDRHGDRTDDKDRGKDHRRDEPRGKERDDRDRHSRQDRDRERDRPKESDRTDRDSRKDQDRRRPERSEIAPETSRIESSALPAPFSIKGRSEAAKSAQIPSGSGRRLGLGPESALEQATRDNTRSRGRSAGIGRSETPPNSADTSRKRPLDGETGKTDADLMSRLNNDEGRHKRSRQSEPERESRSRSSRR